LKEKGYKTFTALMIVVVTLLLQGCSSDLLDVIEGFTNPVHTESSDVPKPSQAAIELHNRLSYVTDMHADTLQFVKEDGPYDSYDRILKNEKELGHVDLPRLLKGNVSLQIFSVFTKGSLDVYEGFEFQCGNPEDNTCLKQSFSRDPDIRRYDDPQRPYADDLGCWLSRDVGVYFTWLLGRPCEQWYQNGDWIFDYSILDLSKKDCPRFHELLKNHPDFLTNRVHAERALWTAGLADRIGQKSEKLTIIRNRNELIQHEQKMRSGHAKEVAGLLSMEGLYFRSQKYASNGSRDSYLLDTFNEYYNAGYRMMSLTHFLDNDWGGSSTGVKKGGITKEGEELVRLMFEKGVIVDVAHASPTLIRDIVKLAIQARKPVVYSHGGLSQYKPEHPLCSRVRNIGDEQIRQIASTGGVVGIGHGHHFNCGTKPADSVEAMMHAIKVIDREPLYYNDIHGERKLVRGVEHVSLGSDYDGGIQAHTSTKHLVKITESLMSQQCKKGNGKDERCFSDNEIELLMGKNSWKLIHDQLPES